eukprot:1619474-Amphidinium_carterae.1
MLPALNDPQQAGKSLACANSSGRISGLLSTRRSNCPCQDLVSAWLQHIARHAIEAYEARRTGVSR